MILPIEPMVLPVRFRGVSVARMKTALFAADDLLQSVLRVDDPARGIENTLRDAISGELESRLDDVIKAAFDAITGGMSDLFTVEDMRVILAAIEPEVTDGWAAALDPAVGTAVEDAYALGRDRIMKMVGEDPAYGQVDELAKQVLADDTMFWVGNAWDNELGGQIASIIREKVIDEGLSREEAGDALEEALGEDFPDRAGNYWDVVAAAGTVRARTFGTVESFRQAKVVTYLWRALADDRSCETCMYLNGRTFQTDDAVEQRDKFLDARDPEEAKDVHPWVSFEEIQGMSTDELAEEGILQPPIHGRCRCVLLVGSFEGEGEEGGGSEGGEEPPAPAGESEE